MQIELNDKHNFISGHLFENVSNEKTYTVIKKSGFGYRITDDSGKDILISNTAFKDYFKKC